MSGKPGSPALYRSATEHPSCRNTAFSASWLPSFFPRLTLPTAPPPGCASAGRSARRRSRTSLGTGATHPSGWARMRPDLEGAPEAGGRSDARRSWRIRKGVRVECFPTSCGRSSRRQTPRLQTGARPLASRCTECTALYGTGPCAPAPRPSASSLPSWRLVPPKDVLELRDLVRAPAREVGLDAVVLEALEHLAPHLLRHGAEAQRPRDTNVDLVPSQGPQVDLADLVVALDVCVSLDLLERGVRVHVGIEAVVVVPHEGRQRMSLAKVLQVAVRAKLGRQLVANLVPAAAHLLGVLSGIGAPGNELLARHRVDAPHQPPPHRALLRPLRGNLAPSHVGPPSSRPACGAGSLPSVSPAAGQAEAPGGRRRSCAGPRQSTRSSRPVAAWRRPRAGWPRLA